MTLTPPEAGILAVAAAATAPGILLIVAVLIADSTLPRTRRLLCARLLDAVTDTAALLLAIGIILGAVVAVIITLRLAAQLLGVLP